jgi:putative DNA methylase
MVEPAKLGRRFLEDSFPIKEVSKESAKEKMIRHGHISTLHIWWARRPLASSRAINYTALISVLNQIEDHQAKKEFVVKLSKWANSLDSRLLETARNDILEANAGKQPKILDPFAGGGAIPLEAYRLGCDVYSSDYNPVANLVQKCILEYPQKYGNAVEKGGCALVSHSTNDRLVTDVRRWSDWVLGEAQKQIGDFYPMDKDGSYAVGYIWARTIPCQNPSCNAEIPLMRQYWLANDEDKKVSLYPYRSNKEVKFKIVGVGYEPIHHNFDPNKGSVSRAVATCYICGSSIDGTSLRAIFAKNQSSERMVCAITKRTGSSGKKYRAVTEDDLFAFEKAERYLKEIRGLLQEKWGIDPVPDEPTPEGGGAGAERAFAIHRYGMTHWGDLFNSRQKLALITFVEAVKRAFSKMIEFGYDPEYAKAVTTYLSLGVDRLADYNSRLCMWASSKELIAHTFSRQVLQMTWDYIEVNPFSEATGNWRGSFEYVLKVLKHCSGIPANSMPHLKMSSATMLQHDNDFFDAVFTDPPYYDNVPYSHLSDFFYVWLKRSIGPLYPELFSTPLSPKSKEIVAYSYAKGGLKEGKLFFEDMLKKSFVEINRVLKPNGIAVIVYAHKSTAGWETLVNSLLDSGLVITAAWPIHTEMRARLRALNSAALSSSIYIVARKMQKTKIGIYKDVKEELLDFLNTKMDLLWKEGVSGADFLISAIGSSIVVFGKYEQVLRENDVVRADVMLEDVRRIVTDYAVKQVLHNGFAAEISNLTRFYLLWRWSYGGAILQFDDARKLSQSTLVDLSHEWSKPNGVIRKQKENVCLLGPQDRNLEEIASLEKKDLIDVLHMALLLWQKGDREALVDLLSETGLGNKDSFYRVAQAISETLPKESQEKKLIEGFLAGKERLSSETKKINVQKRLLE